MLCHPQFWNAVQGSQAQGLSLLVELDSSKRWWAQTLDADGNLGARRQLDVPAPRYRRFNWLARQTVAVVGPDGSGKTTLIDGLRADSVLAERYRFKRFKRYFRRVLFHWRKGRDRNELEESMPWLILPLAWLGFGVSRGLFWWLGPLVLDRYFYDYLLADVRHPDKYLRKIRGYHFFSALVPRPQSLLVASCPADQVHARKAEMSLANIEALYQVYCDQIIRSGVRRILFCHTGISPADSQAHACAFLRG